MATNSGKQIIEIMGNTGRQLADGFHLLGLDQPILCQSALGAHFLARGFEHLTHAILLPIDGPPQDEFGHEDSLVPQDTSENDHRESRRHKGKAPKRRFVGSTEPPHRSGQDQPGEPVCRQRHRVERDRPARYHPRRHRDEKRLRQPFDLRQNDKARIRPEGAQKASLPDTFPVSPQRHSGGKRLVAPGVREHQKIARHCNYDRGPDECIDAGLIFKVEDEGDGKCIDDIGDHHRRRKTRYREGPLGHDFTVRNTGHVIDKMPMIPSFGLEKKA
ncbi:hypothetical protein [Palleronia abyssalis]|uniref:hypothetical protein n=1 Tax=Palleronia abyssalis TaxID=1501240 RepID=UPI0015E7F18F|nr:hypothetical protein [Palleronia abyssalis]